MEVVYTGIYIYNIYTSSVYTISIINLNAFVHSIDIFPVAHTSFRCQKRVLRMILNQKHVLANYYGIQHHVLRSALRGETLLREKNGICHKIEETMQKTDKNGCFCCF